MKTDRKALLWGTIIGVVFVAAAIVQAFEFPHFRLPFIVRDKDAVAFIDSACIFGLLIAAYRKLWKSVGFWGLLLAYLGAHIVLYWLVIANITGGLGGLRLIGFYGFVSTMEVFAFAVIVAKLYHRGPDTSSFTGPKER